jgi:hypothetical protein
MKRSKIAEIHTAWFASTPLIGECVFLNPAFSDGQRAREACDLLLVLRDQAIVVQMKTQDKLRAGEKLIRWVERETRKAARQIKGAIRTIGSQAVWSDHPRRGRVKFEAGHLKPVHGLVIVDTSREVATGISLPRSCGGIPVSYLSTNDFLNLIDELRAFPEIVLYLAQRAMFAERAEIPLGAERTVYGAYLVNEGGFGNCCNCDELAEALKGTSLDGLFREKRAADEAARVVEHFVDSLAARVADWDKGLSAELLRGFDASNGRKNYLRIQEEFCDLRLADRRALGRQLLELRSMVDASTRPDMAYSSAWFESNPDVLYIVAASRGIPRAEVLMRGQYLLAAGLAFYGKQEGVLVTDRDREGFEFTLMCDFRPLPDHLALGDQLFGKLRCFSLLGSIGPVLRNLGTERM